MNSMRPDYILAHFPFRHHGLFLLEFLFLSTVVAAVVVLEISLSY